MKAKKPVLHLFVGNIASGKSTLAQKIKSTDDVLIDLDKLGQLSLNLNELEDKIHRLYFNAIDNNLNILIDANLMSIKDRKKYIDHAVKKGYWIICYDFGPGKLEQLDYRILNNQEHSKETWKDSFYTKQSMYEQPSMDELINEIVIKNASHF